MSTSRYCSHPTGHGETCDNELDEDAPGPECSYHTRDDSGDGPPPDERCTPDEAIAAQLARVGVAPDLRALVRALVRARMVALSLTQAELARRMAPRWGCIEDSATRRLSRWFNRTPGGNMSGDALAELLAELGGAVTWAP